MDIPMQIIRRYKPFRTDKRLFNIGSLDTVNKRIKAVAKKCGIEKPISFHLSRHSFAVLALNYSMPIESVSKILGYTNITTTQLYAKVASKKLENDISAFESTAGKCRTRKRNTKGSVISESYHLESQEMVSAVPRVGVHGEVLPEWFKEQFNKLFSSIRRTVTQPRGIKL